MGKRFNNLIVLKPGILLTEELSKYINNDCASIEIDERGTLIQYESNFTPMFARDGKGVHCTYDLEEEIAVHRFLGGLDVNSFLMIRVGNDEDETRGQWTEHTFAGHPDVIEHMDAYHML